MNEIIVAKRPDLSCSWNSANVETGESVDLWSKTNILNYDHTSYRSAANFATALKSDIFCA